ncbi:MAG: hypothetical protein LBK72_02645 [Bifidobacteriaceae bacterium]|nr:hypothetical protein [Bifidobacteriaceae bacterium]
MKVSAVVASAALAVTGLMAVPADAVPAGKCSFDGGQGYSLPAMYSVNVTSCTAGRTIRAGVYYYNSSSGGTKYGPVWSASTSKTGTLNSGKGPSASYFAQGTTSE